MFLDVKAWKKMVDPYMFLSGSVNHHDDIHGLFPQLEIRYGWSKGAACSMVVDQMLKRPGEIT